MKRKVHLQSLRSQLQTVSLIDQTHWNVPSDVQLFAVSGQADQAFYFHNGDKDTVSFVKVADELVKDTKLGYKYVTENEAKVQTYLFNYLHGLAENKYLNTPSDKDSIVRVERMVLKQISV